MPAEPKTNYDLFIHRSSLYQGLLAEHNQAQVDTQALREQVAQLTQALEQSQKDYCDLESGRITIKDLAIRNGSLTAEFGTEMAGVLANQFFAILDQVGAENYVEMSFLDKEDPAKKVVVIVQRVFGKSPHQLRQEAEAALVTLRGQLDAQGS